MVLVRNNGEFEISEFVLAGSINYVLVIMTNSVKFVHFTVYFVRWFKTSAFFVFSIIVTFSPDVL